MNDRYKIEKVFIPCETNPATVTALKFITDLETKKVQVGIGEDEWVIRNGIFLEELTKGKFGVTDNE